MTTKLTIESAKQLTLDTRAVLHEFKILHKSIDFVKETAKDIGINTIDDYTNDNGIIKTKEYLVRFNVEVKKELENLGRIKLPFTREASAKLAVCARHSRPLVSHALTVHSQEVYNLAYDLTFELKSYAAIVNQKLDVIHSSLDKTQFVLFANGQGDTAQMFFPKKYPRYLPNLSLYDPDGFLVGDLESYKAILGAYADYAMQLENMLEPWNELSEMLEMWQRTCGKANPNLTVKGPLPEIKPPNSTRLGRVSYSYSTPVPPIESNSSTNNSNGIFSASALLGGNNLVTSPVMVSNLRHSSQAPSSAVTTSPTVNFSYSSSPQVQQQSPLQYQQQQPSQQQPQQPYQSLQQSQQFQSQQQPQQYQSQQQSQQFQSQQQPQQYQSQQQPQQYQSQQYQQSPQQSQLSAQYFVAAPTQQKPSSGDQFTRSPTISRPAVPQDSPMMNTLVVPDTLPPLPITPNYNRINEDYSGSESSMNRFGEATLARALNDMDKYGQY